MARDFLATPASSAPVERQFSRAALTVTKTRNRLERSVLTGGLDQRHWASVLIFIVCRTDTVNRGYFDFKDYFDTFGSYFDDVPRSSEEARNFEVMCI